MAIDRLDKIEPPFAEAEILAAEELLRHLVWELDTVGAVEAELQTKAPRELRAIAVAVARQQRFEMHLGDARPTDVGAGEAYERWAGHLGLGQVEP